MELFRISDIPRAAVSNPLFVGDVFLQATPMPEAASDYTLRVVTYGPGARNVIHRHTSDQLIVVTAGTGLVGAQDEIVQVRPGDIVVIPAMEYHWHGADVSGEVTQVSVTGRDSTTMAQAAAD